MRTLELLSANNPVAKMYNTTAVRNASISLEVQDYDEITPEEYKYLNNPTNENFMKWLASM